MTFKDAIALTSMGNMEGPVMTCQQIDFKKIMDNMKSGGNPEDSHVIRLGCPKGKKIGPISVFGTIKSRHTVCSDITS